MTDFNEITKLVELFGSNQKDGHSDSDEEFTNGRLTSADIKHEGKANIISTNMPNTKENPKRNPYAKVVNQKDELKAGSVIEDPFDEQAFIEAEQQSDVCAEWRQCPQWDISYRQQVTPSDMFLQMSGKNTATSSCEDMIVSVHLPGEDRQNIDLKVLSNRLNLKSPKFYLDVVLPHPVDPQKGNAQWDKIAQKLIITLTMNREFDYVNF